MGQKSNPIGLRLGIIRGWDSNWFASKTEYPKKLIEDNKIRNYLNARINKGGISKIVIERTLNKLIVTIHTSKPGIIIGKGGGEVDRIKEELKKLILSSKKIICRSGYSTLMDMHLLGKKELVLIPTPGQSEQEYLADYWKQKFGTEHLPQNKISTFTL